MHPPDAGRAGKRPGWRHRRRELQERGGVFEDGELRLHRSGTGVHVFRLRLAPLHERPGHWQVEEAVLNRHPAQYGPADETEALAMLQDLIVSLLLRLP